MVTTNLIETASLEQQIGRRTVSRLTEMTDQLPLFGPDLRERYDPARVGARLADRSYTLLRCAWNSRLGRPVGRRR